MNIVLPHILNALKETGLFIGNTDDSKLIDKQSILLVLSGDKPLSEVSASKWEDTESGRRSVPEDADRVVEMLSELGLVFSVDEDEYMTRAIISLDKGLVDAYPLADSSEAGRLFGYPESAVVAFSNKEELLDFDEQERLMMASGMPVDMPLFRLSKTHHMEEIAVLKRWHDTLKTYGMLS